MLEVVHPLIINQHALVMIPHGLLQILHPHFEWFKRQDYGGKVIFSGMTSLLYLIRMY
jgi:hypothetical protein